MLHYKKITAVVLALTMACALTSCKKETANTDTTLVTTTTTSATTATTTSAVVTTTTTTTVTTTSSITNQTTTTTTKATSGNTTATPTAVPTTAKTTAQAAAPTTAATASRPAATTTTTSAVPNHNECHHNGKTFDVPVGVDPIDYTMKQARVDVDRPNRALEEEIHNLINAERVAAGLPALVFNNDAYHFVQTRANECIQLYSHTRPDGTKWSTVYSDVYFIGTMGENLLRGPAGECSSKEYVDAWMNSEGHRNNILNTNFESAALAVVIIDGEIFIVHNFYSYIPS